MRTIILVTVVSILLMALASACAPVVAPQQAPAEVPAEEADMAAPSLTGTFVSVIPADNRPEIPEEFGMMAGKWHMTLNEDGTFQLYQEDILRVEGTYKMLDDVIEYSDLSGDYSRPESLGIYRWTLDDEQLRLQVVTDPVEPRRFALTCPGWRRL